MKKFRGTTIAAISAVVLSLSSCMSNSMPSIDFLPSDNTDKEKEALHVELGTVTQSNTYKFSVKASTTVELYIDDARVAISSSYDKGEKKKNSTIKVKAIATSSEYSSVPVEKYVTLDTNGKVIYIDIPKLASKSATVTASQAKATANSKGSVVISNSATNQSLAYSAKTQAKITLSSAAISNISDDKALAIDIENASTSNIVQELKNQTEEFFNVMVIRSSAYGTKLNETSTLSINNSNFEEGMIFKCTSDNMEKTISKSSALSLDINELSDYTISCQARLVLADSIDCEKEEGFFTVPIGNREITYYTKSGFTCDYTSNEFINKYLTAKFGAYTNKGKQTVTIVNTSNKANVPYEISQKKYLYKASFGTLVVDVYVYGPETLTVKADKAEKYTTSK